MGRPRPSRIGPASISGTDAQAPPIVPGPAFAQGLTPRLRPGPASTSGTSALRLRLLSRGERRPGPARRRPGPAPSPLHSPPRPRLSRPAEGTCVSSSRGRLHKREGHSSFRCDFFVSSSPRPQMAQVALRTRRPSLEPRAAGRRRRARSAPRGAQRLSLRGPRRAHHFARTREGGPSRARPRRRAGRPRASGPPRELLPQRRVRCLAP